MRVAIIGGGAAGMAAAWRLAEGGAEVVLYEARPEPGGHCFGVTVDTGDGPSGPIEVDAGVSDFNVNSFHNVRRMFERLGLRWSPIGQDASFAFPDGRTCYWLRDGALHPGAGLDDGDRLMAEIKRFNASCLEVLEQPGYEDWTAARYLAENGYSEDLRLRWFAPRAGGCFPMPECPPEDFLIREIVAFWHIHGIVGTPGRRMVLEGGMATWPRAFAAQFPGELRCGWRVLGISRRESGQSGGVRVAAEDMFGAQQEDRFDQVVMACNSNEVLGLFEDVSHAQSAAFAGMRWQRARVYVHRDTRLMPDRREAWSAYNYVIDGPEADGPDARIERPSIHFWPRALTKRADMPEDVFVSVNPHRAPDKVLSSRFLVHPAADRSRAFSVARVEALQGADRTWYAGGWLRPPHVHEPAFCSGLDVADRILSGADHRPRPHFVDFLREVPLMQGVDGCLLADLDYIGEPVSLPAGAALYREGAAPDGIWFIREGEVEVQTGTGVQRHGSGEIAGVVESVDGDPRIGTATVIAPLDGWYVSAARLGLLRADARPEAQILVQRLAREVSRLINGLLAEIASTASPPSFGSAALREHAAEGAAPFGARRRFPDGGVVLRRGERVTEAWCLISGFIDAGSFLVAPGGIAGLPGLYGQGVALYDYTAHGDVEAVALNRADIAGIRRDHPAVADAIDRALAGWYRLCAQPGG